MSAADSHPENRLPANGDSLDCLVGPVSNRDLGMKPSEFSEVVCSLVARHVGDDTDDDDEILGDLEPDFTLDDLEWSEEYE